MSNDRLQIAMKQLEFSREYVLSMIQDVADEDWFRMPHGSATHVAWQIGHLAMAQYGLCLFRVRGRRPEDTELMSSEFRKKYSRGTIPDPDPASNPPPESIREIFHRIHKQSLEELSALTDAELDAPVEMPYSVSPTKLGAIFFCSAHEMLHAGQIGVLRRLLGKSPIR